MKNSKGKNRSSNSMNDELMSGMGSKTGQIIAAAVIGAAAGAIAGIMLAPSSGRETLNNMSRKANQLKNDLSDSVKEYTSMGKEKYNEMVGAESKNGQTASTYANGSSSNSSGKKAGNTSNSNI